jgi:SAM-dependent methyltransferase
MLDRITRLYDKTPRQLVRAVANRLGPRNGSFEIDDIVSSQKHMRTQRLYDFLSRYETIAHRALEDWQSLEFEGRRVLEIGCGPLLGWAPLAIFKGCRSYVCVEPMFNPAVLEHSVVRERYLPALHKDFTAVYGPRMDFDEFLARFLNDVTVERCGLADAQIEEPVDITLSNSVLEHIHPLEEAVATLRRVSATGSRFLHLVDFGNHRSTRNPFDGVYGVKPAIYRAKVDSSINLLRGTDVVQIFRDTGFAVDLVPYYSAPEFHDGDICDYWRERYADQDLFLKAALLVGTQ